MDNLKEFTHFDESGNAIMVDVGDKDITKRTASAEGYVYVNENTFNMIKSGGTKKGDVLNVARIAGIMGAKKTPEIIPLCHPILTNKIEINFELCEESFSIRIISLVSCSGKTGVEMEAMCAASIAALTIYDMCKAIQRDIEISNIRLLSKTGGVHGEFSR